MKVESKKIKFVLMAAHFSLIFFLQGCTADNTTQSNQLPGTAESAQADTKKSDTKNVIEKVQADSIQNKTLSTGGCPRGLHCGATGRCGLYTDVQNDQYCDLGEQSN
jgi:hypothetical protein